MPSKNHSFLVLIAGIAGNQHQKLDISGAATPLPNPHRVVLLLKSINLNMVY
jgi:hypothetical protein